MKNADISYSKIYEGIDFRKHPEKYCIGRGEQGVLIVEPYKSEILPYWKFKTVEIAKKSATKIYTLFKNYCRQNDFVGMDMARKYLQMGWTRARRYANHPSGRKYDNKRNIKPQAKDALSSEKAQSAAIFYTFYQKAKNNKKYLRMKALHQQM